MDLNKETEAGERNRAAIRILVGLIVVGAVLGLFVGLVGASALRAIGIKPVDDPPAAAPSVTATPTPAPASSAPPTTSAPQPSPNSVTQLAARPKSASPGERITLRGQLPGVDPDAVLQVQRKMTGEAWEDFPVTARTERDGDFSTWVVTSRTGRTKWRLVSRQADVKTPVVTVRIG